LIKRIAIISILAIFASSNISTADSNTNYLPISAVTPGAINPTVTQSNISTTICVVGYTTKIRPAASYTTALKQKQLATTYSRYGSSSTALFEEDHLIPLEIGGSPKDPKNLWPEPWSGALGARKKDALENKLHLMICARLITLAEAQQAFATNWIDAYNKYILKINTPEATPAPAEASLPTDSPSLVATPNPSTSSSVPLSATGKCKDGTYSSAKSHSGMCSKHGGVAQFYSSVNS